MDASSSGAVDWVADGEYADIRYERSREPGIAKITINRPEVRNAFRPQTVLELAEAFTRAREDTTVGVIVLTGEGPDAFCSGGDQRVRGDTGYESEPGGVGRFHVTDLHVQIRRTPKPVVAMVAGYAIGGGHVLHVICDLTIAAENARFGQTGPRVGSFDGGYGASISRHHATVSCSSRASGTTALTSPHSSAWAASYWRHRNQISRAFF